MPTTSGPNPQPWNHTMTMTEGPSWKIAPQMRNGKARDDYTAAFATQESVFAQTHDQMLNASTPPKVEDHPVFGNVRKRDADMRLANRVDSKSGLKGGCGGAMLPNGKRRGLQSAAARHR